MSRCEEIHESLVSLAYDDIDAAGAARCQEHLAECAACRAELDQLRAVQRLLDGVGVDQAQVDLAAVCLRLARCREQGWRHARSFALVAAAAALLTMVGLSWFRIAVEPGRLIVAWRPTAAPLVPQDPRPMASEPGGRDPAGLSALAQAAARSARRDERTLAALLDSPELHVWAPRGGSPQLDPRWPVLAGGEPAAGQAVGQPAASSSYSELRRRLIDGEPGDRLRQGIPGM